MSEKVDISSAVALVFCRENESLLLLKRADNPKDPWSGHWALPGGRREEQDQTLLETAMRECLEECGLAIDKENFIKALPVSYAGKSMGKLIAVQSYYFEIDSIPDLTLQETEIAKAYWLSLEEWRNAEHRELFLSTTYPDRAFPSIDLLGTELWGFTYQVIANFLK